MTAAEKAAARQWLRRSAQTAGGHYVTLDALLAEPRLPKEPVSRCFPDTVRYTRAEFDAVVDAIRFYHLALYAHLTRPHVDFAALDEARMDDSSHAGASPIDPAAKKVALEWLEDRAANSLFSGRRDAKIIQQMLAERRSEENPELRKAISVLRGWSAEAAGRTGLAESVLIVCNAAEATLPRQMYRVRNGAALDVICPGPISISEVSDGQ